MPINKQVPFHPDSAAASADTARDETRVEPTSAPRPPQASLKWAIGGGLLLVVACGLRLPNLGRLGLWGDEGYTALSAEAILEYGYPRLPSGGVYPRSLPFLYLEALSVHLLGRTEFALRLPSVAFGLATIGLVYLFGKRLFGPLVGGMAAAALVLSQWEIEFARYARMYALFQFMYLLSIYVFYRGFIEGYKSYKLISFPVWLLTLFVHNLGVILSVFLIFPLVQKEHSYIKKCIFLINFLAFMSTWRLFNYISNILRYGTSENNNKVVESGSSLPIALPMYNILSDFLSKINILFICGFFSIAIFFIILEIRNFDKNEKWRYLYVLLIIMSSLMHQIGVASILLFSYTILFFNRPDDWKQKPFQIGCGVLFACLLFWGGYGLYSGIPSTKIAVGMLGYPYVADRFLKFYVPGWPVEMLTAFLGLVMLWWGYVKNRNLNELFLLYAIVMPILFVGIAAARDNSARYSFHLFPFIILVSALFFVNVIRKIRGKILKYSISVATLIWIVTFSGDYNLIGKQEIINRDYGYTFTRPIPMSLSSYPFYPDNKTTSFYIKNHYEKGDLVISMREVIPYYYVRKVDYLWKGDESISAKISDSGVGTVQILTNREFDILIKKSKKKIWFFLDPFRSKKIEEKNIKTAVQILDSISKCKVYTGKDRMTSIYLFSSDANQHIRCHISDSQATTGGA